MRVGLDPEPAKRHIEASRSRIPQRDLPIRRPPRAAAWREADMTRGCRGLWQGARERCKTPSQNGSPGESRAWPCLRNPGPLSRSPDLPAPLLSQLPSGHTEGHNGLQEDVHSRHLFRWHAGAAVGVTHDWLMATASRFHPRSALRDCVRIRPAHLNNGAV